MDAANPSASAGEEPIPLDYATPEEILDPRWHVGTLVYTASGLVVLFCWLLWGDFAVSMKERSVPDVLRLLMKKFEASDTLAALLIGSLPPMITILIGPVIAYKSDRHRGRWGRRIPYMLVATPFAVLAMVGLAYSPALGPRLGRGLSMSPNFAVLFCLGLSWTVFEVASITANSIFGAFVNDVVPHARMGRFFGLFRAISLIAGMIFMYWLFGKAEQYYVPIFLGIALLYGLGFTAMCLKVKEGQYPPPEVLAHNNGTLWSKIKEYFRDCFSHPYYVCIFAAWTLANMAFQPINLFNLYFAKSVSMSMPTYGKWMAFYFCISLAQAYPIGWLADRFHPLRVAMGALLLHGAASLWGGLSIHTTGTFAIGFVLTGALSGTYFTATAALQQVLFPKIKFATFASACGIVNSLGLMAIGPLVGKILDHTHHNYRYSYMAGFALDASALLLFAVVVYPMFKRLGGPDRYIAPL